MTIITYAEKMRFFDQKIQTWKFFEIIDLKKGCHFVFFTKTMHGLTLTEHGLILANIACFIITLS
jgi:hypothetical protein